MPEPHAFALFMGASLALLLTPGPAVLYIVGRSVDQGVRAGLVSAMGLATGGALHMLAAVVGISALLAASSSALAALAWAGAAYLGWLGWRELRPSPPRRGEAPSPARTPTQLYRQGVLVSVLNPKAVLFFLAFLPQFVRPGGADPRLQVLALGGTFLGLAVCTDALWAVTAARAGRRLRGPGAQRVRRWVSATIYFALAVGAAWPRV
ncbi:MAG TPA: LysE family translocator [Longimicrobiales bacterium]|nr:LysE family translocator [Longimicrobiales bacterium]